MLEIDGRRGLSLSDRGTSSVRKLILFELNEVPLRVVERYMERRPQSFLARSWARLRKFSTFTTDRGHLHPWVTWPTFHRGVDNTEHGLAHLGQPVEPVETRLPSLWRILAAHGVRVGVFGSLHSWAMPANVAEYAFYLPDYFATSDRAYPASLVDFQAFNLSMSRRSAGNVDVGLPLAPARRFLKKAVPLGVRPQTLFEAGLQLGWERVRPARKFRRRDLQALMMADVFLRQLATTRPDFATFFTNNVAASMHRFWAAMFPEDYKELPLSVEWRSDYRDAILASLGSMDGVLERLARFVDRNPDYRLLIASSMGQVAIPIKREPIFFTIVDLEKFMDQMGVGAGEWSEGAVMVPHRCVTVVPEKREIFRSRLESLVVCGQRMKFQKEEVPPLGYDVGDDGYFHLAIQFDERTDAEVMLGSEPRTAEEVGLGPFRMEEGLNTGYHHAEGMALLYDPVESHADESRRDVPTTDFAPSILRSFRIPSPDYMKGDGRHLDS